MKQLFTFLFTICGFMLAAQGVTTSSMSGQITDTNGEGLIGANVIAVHTPTGTTYGNSTDLDGYFRISNMKVGGPYSITVSYTGYEDKVENNVFLKLGSPYALNTKLGEAAIELEGVEVVAQAIFAGQGQGASTDISAEDIDLMPTLNRNLNDFTRLTPQAKETFGGGFSIAGMNNRFNAIYIDGAVNNDVFGLAANGTNGGQTGIAPFSVDILDQIQVVVSPYDVTLGGFAGGGINAVTKSGTNKFQGTAYYFLQNQSFAGKTNGTLAENIGLSDDDRTRLADFTQTTYGASLGGPIIKNKLFFFANVELQDDETPAPFEIGEYIGNSSEADLNNLSSVLQNQYGYDPGVFGSKADQIEGLKLFGKLDYNLSDNHKLTLRHQYTKAEQRNVNGSNVRTINFEGNGVFFPTTTNSTALELNSSLGNNASNNLIIGYTSVFDDRDPIGSDFPYVTIEDGDGSIRFGSEQFSTANQLDQKIFTITNNLKLYKGKHTITLGTHNEFYSIYNLFIRQNFGSYRFGSLNDFLTGAPAEEYDRSYSLVDDKTGDGSAAAADFSAMQLGVYIQDKIQVNNRLQVTAGIRLDVPFITTEQNVASDFNTSTLPSIAAQYDIEGAEGGELPQGQLMFSPRVGFNYDLKGDQKTVLRGGLGIFTSRVPFVWPGGAYTNNGLTVGGLNERDVDGDILFNPDPNTQLENPNFTVPSGQVDLFAKDFKYPQVLRGSLALDKVFGNNWLFSVEGIYTKTLNNVFYRNVNSDPTVDFTWTGGPDNRQVFTRNNIDPTYTAVYLATNTNEGYTTNLTASLSKNFASGLNLYVAATLGDSEAVFEGTSSQNSSQWRGAMTIDGRNNAIIGRSDFSLGSRIIGALGYVIDWTKNGNFNTTISLFYQGEAGSPYSYVYGNGFNEDTRRSIFASNLNNEGGSTSRNRSLIYIPATASDINLEDPSQWAALDNFISQDSYLSKNRGSYALKNGGRTPFESQFDFKLMQDFGVNGHKFQLSFDIFNLANFVNNDWGVIYNNPFAFEVLDFEGYAADGTTPTFSFTEDRLGNDRFGINGTLSRWRMRLGLRYIFR